MKSLRFSEPLPALILDGEKDTTWRVDDEKDLSVDDRLSLRDTDGEEFAQARILWVKETTFGRLTDEDRAGHESFESETEMYETYEEYYGREITAETPVKVVRFKLTEAS
ncbi:MAG: ASCH domain-containing protein [Candidatus Nanohaloarchaea archaeon]|nr:ASCH domain-containing protein [Candidatus Nanohaloarchaea archaeon]